MACIIGSAVCRFCTPELPTASILELPAPSGSTALAALAAAELPVQATDFSAMCAGHQGLRDDPGEQHLPRSHPPGPHSRQG